MNPDHETLVQKEIERLRTYPFKNMGEFDYREIDYSDATIIRPAFQAAKDRSKEENPRPFCCQCHDMKGSKGSKAGRTWIMIKGNISGSLSFPLSYFKNPIQKEFFPAFAVFALKETFNHFAPGEFTCKFPNDIVCRKHWRKCCGSLYKYYDNYAIGTIGVDIAGNPEDSELRKEGLKACCLKNHVEKLPTFEEFMCTAMNKTIEYMNKYDDPYKIVELFNSNYNEFTFKNFRVEVNNPNADPSVDGACYCSSSPNAMLKGFINGEIYDFDSNFYDPIDAPPATDDFYVKFDKVMLEQLKLDEQERERLRKLEEEQKNKDPEH